MKYRSSILAGLLCVAIGLAGQAPATAAEDEESTPPAIEPEALSALKGMTDYLTSAEAFGFKSEFSYDVVQESGVKVEFGASKHTLIARPNRLRAESQRRDGRRVLMIFDGETIWTYSPEHNVYAKTEQHGDLDEAVHFAITELRIKAPLADLVSPDLYDIITGNLESALHLGASVVAGVECHHLLMSNDYADYQMWITTGDEPVLRRIVITYREERGEPQFRAQFLKWNMAPADADSLLEFKPPKDAELIRFYIPGSEDALGEEDAS